MRVVLVMHARASSVMGNQSRAAEVEVRGRLVHVQEASHAEIEPVPVATGGFRRKTGYRELPSV